MGTFFWLFSRVSGSLSIVLLALALSSGLYLLSGLAEEFPSTTAKVLRYSLAVIALLQALLWLDGLPLMETTVEFLALGAVRRAGLRRHEHPLAAILPADSSGRSLCTGLLRRTSLVLAMRSRGFAHHLRAMPAALREPCSG
eukprot:scaffold857_cov152-Ochromonas_danica.AAC.12